MISLQSQELSLLSPEVFFQTPENCDRQNQDRNGEEDIMNRRRVSEYSYLTLDDLAFCAMPAKGVYRRQRGEQNWNLSVVDTSPESDKMPCLFVGDCVNFHLPFYLEKAELSEQIERRFLISLWIDICILFILFILFMYLYILKIL